jgi:acylphosphatase
MVAGPFGRGNAILLRMAAVKHLRIAGQVQGVGYRMGMERKARELGATGWVRNRHDGTVEAMVQGTPEAVEAMIEWARRGPRAAIVTDVKVSEGSGEFGGFAARPTE